MSSIKDKAINVGLSVLISGSLIILGADMTIKIQKNRRISLRERVYELVQQKYEGDYYTKIDGKDLHIWASNYQSSQSNNNTRCLYLEIKSEKGEIYFIDMAKTGSAEDSFLGKLDLLIGFNWKGEVKSSEKEFDNYLKLVKKEIGKP